MTVSMPRPSKLFATFSAVVIAANLWLLSIVIAANVVEPNPFAVIGGLFFCPLCLFMAAQQYLGTFRLVPSGAAATSLLLFIVGGFLICAFVASTGEALPEGISLRLMAPILIPTWAALSIALGRINAIDESGFCDWVNSGIGSIESQSAGIPLREITSHFTIAPVLGRTKMFSAKAPPPSKLLDLRPVLRATHHCQQGDRQDV